MIYAFLTTMLVAAAVLVPGAEAAGSRNLHVITASASASQDSTNGGKPRRASPSPSPPVVSVTRRSPKTASVSCSANGHSFTIANSKDVHVSAGVPRLDIWPTNMVFSKVSTSLTTGTLILELVGFVTASAEIGDAEVGDVYCGPFTQNCPERYSSMWRMG
jgi:hypothetical protein